MGMFSFFGESEHRVFNYKPIYYDPEEEKRKQMFGAVDGTADKEKAKGTYVPGSYIKGCVTAITAAAAAIWARCRQL